VFRPIEVGGRRVGTIYVLAKLESFDEQFWQLARAGLGVLALALLAAGLLALRLHRLVADPVLELASAARSVAERGDYTVRVPQVSRDELGLLAGSFNAMLDQIELRDGALRTSEERYALAVEGAKEGLWDWDLASDRIYYSPRWMEMLGYGEGELEPEPREWFDRIHPDEAAQFHAALDAHLADASPQLEAEYRLRHRDGGWLWVQTRGVAVRDTAGRPLRMAGSQADVTALKGRDGLTGLPNRVLLVDRLDGALRRARRQPGYQFATLLIGLERFALINETLGRGAGRALLLAAAERIQDTIGTRGTLARLDGDEFALLLEEIGDANEVARLAGDVLGALRPGFHIDDQEIFTSAAMGIALSLTGYERPEDVLRDAGAALSRARGPGSQPIEVFDQEIRARALARLDLENELRRAVESGQLELHYQPIVALAGRRLAGFEALVRWPRTGRLLSPPADFIGLAEETGIIVPLGSWVLREACRQLQRWQMDGGASADLTVSVNVSARQLTRADLLEEVETALRESGLAADRLKLEITESVFVEQLEPDGALVRGLRRLGVGLWLDDFGTGYSNLSYLHRLPIEAIKIDRSFVSALDCESERQEIVDTLTVLARKLGMLTVAEGVETQRQLHRLEGFRCDFAQGFALSPALAPHAVSATLRRAACS
jgi:diguanylate cyclase (GGDEF)-like protein/PAS domain S-box-containing protein